MSYDPEVGRILISIMGPMLAKDHEFRRSLAYFGIGEHETGHHFNFERVHLLAAAEPWLTDDERKTIVEDGNRPTPGAKRFGEFWRSTGFNAIVVKGAWGNYALLAQLRTADEAEAENIYRGLVLFDELNLKKPKDTDVLIRVGRMSRQGIDREYIVAALGLDGS